MKSSWAGTGLGEGEKVARGSAEARLALNQPRKAVSIRILALARTILNATGLKHVVRPLHQAWQDRTLEPLLRTNKQLENLHAGQRIFILGSAPSLSDIDFALLADEYTFGCNFLYQHPKVTSLRRMFYAEIEPLWSFPAIGLDPARYYSAIDRACHDPRTVFFLRAGSKHFFEKRGMFAGRSIYYVASSRNMNEASVLCNDLSRRNTFMDGALVFMIAAAMYMGFKELYLCGCGFTYEPNQEGYFYEEIARPPTSKPVDTRHKRMLALAELNGVTIHNVVPPHFESPVYPATSWKQVVANVLCASGIGPAPGTGLPSHESV